MAVRALVNPTVIINNIHVQPVPNTATVTEGFGDKSVKTRSSGGGAIETVYFQNVENKTSKFKMDLYAVHDVVELHRTWQTLGNLNGISITDIDGYSRTLQNAAQTNDPEIPFGVDKTFTVEFEGEPVI